MQIVTMRTEDLILYAYNPRKHDEAVERMADMLKTYGFRAPILAMKDGTVVDGHLRLKAARSLGMETVPVLVADDMSDEHIKAYRIAVNQSATWAEWDEGRLRRELDELAAQAYNLALTGFSASELSELLEVEPLDIPGLVELDGGRAQYLAAPDGRGDTGKIHLPVQGGQDESGVEALSPPSGIDDSGEVALIVCPKCGMRFKP